MSKKVSRRSERGFAFQVLYSLSFAPAQSLEGVRSAFRKSPDFVEKEDSMDDLHGFAWELVSGIWSREKELDELIAGFSHNWRVNRMGRIELTILRMGLYEMLFREDIPSKVAINEALELSRQYGEESARSFLNGILDATAKALESGEITKRK